MSLDYIRDNYESLTAELQKIAAQSGVKPPKLVSVTKSGSDDELLELFRIGALAMGENRPQELKRRGELLAASGFFPELHEIGNLQTNKVKMIAERVTLIHSLDKLSLAEEINKQAKNFSRKIPVLVEINSAEEDQKGGVLPADSYKFIEDLSRFDSILVSGIMTMGPVVDDPEQIRPYFRKTKKLFDELSNRYGWAGDGILSMGMSDSYTVAIQEGSTLLRVGRRLFQK